MANGLHKIKTSLRAVWRGMRLLAHVAKGISLTAIGMAFGRDRTTVSYACSLIEDLRDDAQFDAELERLEAVLMGAGEND